MRVLVWLTKLGAPDWALKAMERKCPKCGAEQGLDCSTNARVSYIHKERLNEIS